VSTAIHLYVYRISPLGVLIGFTISFPPEEKAIKGIQVRIIRYFIFDRPPQPFLELDGRLPAEFLEGRFNVGAALGRVTRLASPSMLIEPWTGSLVPMG
jgi:hypothetical protein